MRCCLVDYSDALIDAGVLGLIIVNVAGVADDRIVVESVYRSVLVKKSGVALTGVRLSNESIFGSVFEKYWNKIWSVVGMLLGLIGPGEEEL